MRIHSEWISIRNFRQDEPIWCLTFFWNFQRCYAVVFLKGICSGTLNHLAKARSLSFVFFCVRSLILVGSALTFKVNVEQVSKLITLSHDIRLGCLVMGLPFGFLFKMGEIQSHFILGNERDPRQDSETCRYFSLPEERLVDYACAPVDCVRIG